MSLTGKSKEFMSEKKKDTENQKINKNYGCNTILCILKLTYLIYYNHTNK